MTYNAKYVILLIVIDHEILKREVQTMNVNSENTKVKTLIDGLEHLYDTIVPNLDEGLRKTLIDGFDQESTEIVLKKTINYLQSKLDCKPLKTNNFKLTYTFDGCKFYDVVNATDEQTAFEYLCWITDANDDLHFVKAEICDELPSYWCPVDWVKPDPAYVSPPVAQYRSLMQSLEVAGITQHDYYTPELDKVMRSLGYTVSDIILVTDDAFDVFNGKYIEYTRQDHYTLRVEITEEN